MTLFERVKKTAKERGLSLLQLNEKAKLGKNAIYKWSKQKPSTENLQKVATVLHVSVDYLLGRTDNPEPLSEQPAKQRTSDLLAAHIDDDATPDQVQDIIDYIEFKKRQIDKEKGN